MQDTVNHQLLHVVNIPWCRGNFSFFPNKTKCAHQRNFDSISSYHGTCATLTVYQTLDPWVVGSKETINN